MDKNKTIYLKELKNNTSIALGVVLGVLFGFALMMIDKFNMVSSLISQFVKDADFFNGVLTALYAAVLSFVAVLFLIFIINSFRKNITKHDFTLLVYDITVLTFFILSCTVLKVSGSRFVIRLVLLIVGLLLTIARFFTVREENNEKINDVGAYRFSLTRRPYFYWVALLGIELGIGLGFIMNFVDFDAVLGNIFPFWAEFNNIQKLGVDFAVVFTFAIGFNLFTIVEGKNEKVSNVDSFLVFATLTSFFSGIYFAFAKSAPLMQVHAWMIVVLVFFSTLIVRALTVSPALEDDKEELSRAQLYGACTLRKFSVTLLVTLALAVALGFTYLDTIGLAAAFDTLGNIVITVLTIFATLEIISFSIASLILKGFKANKVISLDYTLLLSLFIGLFMMFDLVLAFSVVKVIIWLVAMVVVCVFIALRIKFNTMKIADKVVETIVTYPVDEETPEEAEEELDVVEDEDLDEEVEESEEQEETEEADEVEEVEESDEADENASNEEETPVAEEKERLVIKTSRFTTKLKLCSEQTKTYYSEIKNALLSYGTRDRLSKRCESFRRKGLVAKITISGRTLKLHLALDPKDEEKFPINKYHQIDMSEKRQFVEVPFTLRVKSNRALKRALELIDMLFASRGVNKKRRYVVSDFARDLVIDGEAIFDKIGHPEEMAESYSVDAYQEFAKNNPDAFEKMMSMLPTKKKESDQITEIQNIYIDTVLDKINGDVISLQTLKDANIITKSSNNICIKIHTVLDKKITVYCDEISDDALYAVLSLGGKVYLTK